jgi:hypothetical protein
MEKNCVFSTLAFFRVSLCVFDSLGSQVTPDRGFLDAGESVELTIVTTPFQAESIKAGGIVLDVRGDQVCRRQIANKMFAH